jgi:two-component system KDP operon response regulator KdpE
MGDRVMAIKVLLIDDDKAWCQLVNLMLCKKGFEVDVAYDALTGLKRAYNTKPDVILLDVMLPGMDGRETCRRFREMSDVPIIMLTALSAVGDVVHGLDVGADGYISKPVTGDVLAARIHALLRTVSRSARNRSDSGPILVHDHLVVDFEKQEVLVDGQRIELTPIEYALLSVLVRNRGQVLSHEFLLREVWGLEHIGDSNYLRLYIRYLRRKLEKDPRHPKLIQSAWGVGYRFG